MFHTAFNHATHFEVRAITLRNMIDCIYWFSNVRERKFYFNPKLKSQFSNLKKSTFEFCLTSSKFKFSLKAWVMVTGAITWLALYAWFMSGYSFFPKVTITQKIIRCLLTSSKPAFFFPVKVKSARESDFRPFFTEGKVAFTHTFCFIFTGSQKFSRTHFWIFS